MAKVKKHEFSGKVIRSVTLNGHEVMLDLGKGAFSIREYLGLDEGYKLEINDRVKGKIESNSFNGTYVQDFRVYGPEVRKPHSKGIKVFKRTTTSIPVGYEESAVVEDANLLLTFYK